MPFELNGVLLPNGQIFVSCRDIRERKEKELHIHRLAFYDALTHLPNRRLLYERVQQAMTVSARTGRHAA